MRSCPVCNHTLPQQRVGQPQICAFCGWKDKKKASATPARQKDPAYKALTAEEIARQEWEKDKRGLFTIIGTGILFIAFVVVSIVIATQEPPALPPQPIYREPRPTPTATPTPTPIYTMMPIPSVSPLPSDNPSESATPSTELSSPPPEGEELKDGSPPNDPASASPGENASPSSELTPPPIPSPSGSGPSPSNSP